MSNCVSECLSQSSELKGDHCRYHATFRCAPKRKTIYRQFYLVREISIFYCTHVTLEQQYSAFYATV